MFSAAQIDDNHLKEYKEFIRQGVCSRITFLTDELCSIFAFCSDTMRDLKKTASQSN
jgi:hypothetical protein